MREEQAFPLDIFRKKRENLQRYSSFLVFTGITGKSLYHLLYQTSAMLLGKNTRFRSRKWRPPSCLGPTCGWTPVWVIALRLQVSVNCHKNTNIQGAIFINFNVFPCMRLISVWLVNMPVLDARIYRFHLVSHRENRFFHSNGKRSLFGMYGAARNLFHLWEVQFLKHHTFRFNTLKGIAKNSRCGPLEAEHPKSYQNRFF